MFSNLYNKITNFFNNITLNLFKVNNNMDKHIIADKISVKVSNLSTFNQKTIIPVTNNESVSNFFSFFDINNIIHSFPIKFSAMAQPEFFIPFCGAFVLGGGYYYYSKSYYFGCLSNMSPAMKESFEMKKKILQYVKEDPSFDDNLYIIKLFKIYRYMIKEHLKYGEIYYLTEAGLNMYVASSVLFIISMGCAITYLIAESKITN